MKVKRKNGKRIAKKFKVMAFWNGTVMTELTIPFSAHKETMKILESGFIADGEERDAIEHLTLLEESFFHSMKRLGYYNMGDEKTQVIRMILINDLVRKGFVKNDNNHGIVTMFEYDN